MHEHKPIVVLVDSNPVVVTLSNEVRTIKNVELVYFKLMKMDFTTGPPTNLYLRIDETQSVRSDQIISSNNIPSTVASGFARLRSDTVPLHYKSPNIYFAAGPIPTNVTTVQGKQPKGMRWKAKDVSAMTAFKVTLVDFNGAPYNFGSTGTTMELVFDVEWLPSQTQSPNWRTDKVYMNSMNS
jgi:hypothetical protein